MNKSNDHYLFQFFLFDSLQFSQYYPYEFLRTLKFHNYHVGSGLPVPIEFKNKRNQEHRVEVIKALVQFCQDRGQRTAKVRKMKGYLQPIPVIYRTQSIRSLILKFVKNRLLQLDAANSKDTSIENQLKYVAISIKDMKSVIRIVCPEKITCLRALDVVTENYGRLNFAAILSTMNNLLSIIPLLEEDINLIVYSTNVIEEFIKNDFSSDEHLKLGAGGLLCSHAAHCSYYAFGKFDLKSVHVESNEECGHIHSENCVECNQINIYDKLLSDLTMKIEEIKQSNFINDESVKICFCRLKKHGI